MWQKIKAQAEINKRMYPEGTKIRLINMYSLPGKIVLAICATVILVTAALVIKYTRPVEYRR